MNSVVEARIRDYVQGELHYTPYECNTVIAKIETLARMAGFGLDEQFAFAGLGAGPEAHVASRITDRALNGSGDETPEYVIRKEIDMWLRTHSRFHV